MATKKVLIADLDARTVNIERKLEEVVALTKNAGTRMEAAFTRISNVAEKSINRTSGAMNNFSKRDLGLLANQLLHSSDITGRLGSQLTKLATGLATGGFIGASFAGFAALINMLSKETGDLTAKLENLIKIKSTSGTFDVLPENIPEAIELLKKELAALSDPSVMLPGFQGKIWGSGQRESLEEAIKILETEGKKAQETNNIINTLKAAGLTYTEKTTEKEKEKTIELNRQYDIMDDIYQRMREMDDEMEILGDVTPWGDLFSAEEKKVRKPKWDEIYKHLERSQDPMAGLVSLSNQMASNFQFAGHTFVGQLSQAIAMVDSISNMILTIASMFGGGGGFGITGLLSLIGLEKGGRVSNIHGAISHTKIPSFAMGGSYSTPAFSGPFGGGYPVMVHKNETLDVYSSGQSSRMENKMDKLINAVLTSNLHLSRKGRGGGGIVQVSLDGKVIATVVQKEINNMTRSGRNVGDFR